ncbi:putative nuclease HARBI1 [Aricia agestis]|uniref:putative nuclease HARBI1 n=1 Tax=Aricia agestis TaxID=91739 RepID=UPI001C202C16|nr:putative nuclease HARBI1 [Aricia agestis]
MDAISKDDFRKKYRFTKESVRYIVSLVSEELQKDRRGGGITPELQVLTALRCWGRREFQDDCGDLHGMAQSTVSLVCNRVARAIAGLAHQFIKMPNGIREEEIIMDQFRGIANFPGVIGALDCTHIKLRKIPGDQAQYYINRKGFYSLNVQAVCDAKLRLMNVVARWRGSTHDSRIFSESHLKTRFDQGHFRGRLLGDSGYPLLPYLFTPILRPNNKKLYPHLMKNGRMRNLPLKSMQQY